MKKHSIYLRQDQIEFLRNLDNASEFVREALDIAILNLDRTKAEKTVVLAKAIEELEEKVATQELQIGTNEQQTEKINEAIKEAQNILKLAQRASKGDFEVEQHKGKYRTVIQKEDGKYLLITEGHASEEEAKARTLEKVETVLTTWNLNLKETEKKKKIHLAYIEAQKQKLQDMKKNLEKLYASMM